MVTLRGLKSKVSQSILDAKVNRGNKATTSKSKTKWGLRYIGDPEAQEYGYDPDKWFVFKNKNKTVTFFPTLDELLYAIMTQLKPAKVYAFGMICKINGRNFKRYAEMHILPSPWHASIDFYYFNGRKVAKGKSIMWVEDKYGSESEIYAVDDNGKRTPVYYKDRD